MKRLVLWVLPVAFLNLIFLIFDIDDKYHVPMIILNVFVVFVFLIVFGAKADWQFKSKKYLLTIVFGALLGVAFRFFNFESELLIKIGFILAGIEVFVFRSAFLSYGGSSRAPYASIAFLIAALLK